MLKAGGITAVTAWLYYRSFAAVFLLLPVLAWHLRMMEEESAKKKEDEFQGQFKEAIQAVSAALNAGKIRSGKPRRNCSVSISVTQGSRRNCR